MRENGVTYGTPTWVWCVVVDDELYVRAYNGTRSSWYRAAISRPVGRITIQGKILEVSFTPVEGSVGSQIDAAYREKYVGSPYVAHMVGEIARAATIRIDPIRDAAE